MAHIDPKDLHECLTAYFAGTLDTVAASDSCVCEPLHRWHPDNSLWGQLDSNLMMAALGTIELPEKWAIELYYTQSVETELTLEGACKLFRDEHPQDWIDKCFVEGFNHLKQVLLERL